MSINIVIITFLLLLILIYFNKLILTNKFTDNTSYDKEDITAYVINLKKRSDRWRNISDQSKKHNIKLIKFEAFSPDEKIEYKDIKDKWNYPSFDQLGNFYPYHITASLSDGEKCCIMSHIYLWKYVINNNMDDMLIFEDDIIIDNDFNRQIKKYKKELPNDYDLFMIDYNNVITPTKLTNNLYKLRYAYNTGAYLISNKGARKALSYLPVDSPIDHFLSRLSNKKLLNIYIPRVSFAKQLPISSDIIHT